MLREASAFGYFHRFSCAEAQNQSYGPAGRSEADCHCWPLLLTRQYGEPQSGSRTSPVARKTPPTLPALFSPQQAAPSTRRGD